MEIFKVYFVHYYSSPLQMQYRCYTWHSEFHSPASGYPSQLEEFWHNFYNFLGEKSNLQATVRTASCSVPLVQGSLVNDSGTKMKHNRHPVSVGQWWQYSIGTGEIPTPIIILNVSLVSLKCLFNPWILYQEKVFSSLGLLVNSRERKWHRCFCRNGLIQSNLGACCIPLTLKVSK